MKGAPRHGIDDPVGLYFDCFRQVTGSEIHFDLGAIDARGDVRWTRVDHAEHDAMGALLRETSGAVSVRRAPRPPLQAGRMRATLEYLRSRAGPASTLPVDYEARAPSSRAFLVLSAHDSGALEAAARREGASLNALLLFSIHQALRPTAGACLWSFPVDLRGAVALPDPTANHVVELFLGLDQDSSPSSIARAVRDQLARGLHLSAWRMALLLARLGPRMIRRLIRHDEASMRARRRWGAVFSNLGALQGDPGVAARVLFSPVCPTTPLAATSMSWNGRMTLALQVHPGLAASGLSAPGLLEAWARGLAARVGLTFDSAHKGRAA